MSNRTVGQVQSNSKSKVAESTPKFTSDELAKLRSQIVQLKSQLTQAQSKEMRALADYQNLLRRTQEERGKLIKLIAAEVMSSLLLPIEHLSLLAQKGQDPGVKMVVDELWQVLSQQGLAEIQALGQEFDVEQMEVVEKSGKGTRVTQVIRPGYSLNGQVIQHAKVVVG